MRAFLYGAPIGMLGGLIGLGGGEFRLPVLTGVFRYSAKQAVPLNLAISLFTVVAAFVSRASLTSLHSLLPIVPLLCMLGIGSMIGAHVGSGQVYRLHDMGVEKLVTALLIIIGMLLIAESFWVFEARQLFNSAELNLLLGVLFGLGIGLISSFLGVAGGEVIIPTLVLVFGVDIKDAGTGSLLVSTAPILVGMFRYGKQGRYRSQSDMRIVALMGIGSVIGAVVGGMMLGIMPGQPLKLLLGLLLILSAVKVFRLKRQRTVALERDGEAF
ncbi:MAG: TSUP family transporter [Nitrospira sp.]|nr:TSUP family transporter [Nitrospira sp.]